METRTITTEERIQRLTERRDESVDAIEIERLNKRIEDQKEYLERCREMDLINPYFAGIGKWLISPSQLWDLKRKGVLTCEESVGNRGLHWTEQIFEFKRNGVFVARVTKYSDYGFSSQHSVDISAFIKSI